ncbi:hypothetical protein Dsin_001565 [Dipteronia sinensis]|uniref:Glycosyl transferase 64 domain-containing protein n=1 Tax=Dipteronia sinensis TaxID=43782 RepID=A0AAE0B5V3_9ROSI|nr:hypothetical protein Dsin_001565 [Dipteronia sinensis]
MLLVHFIYDDLPQLSPQHCIPLLQSIAAAYPASPIVFSVLVLWGNPSTSTEILSQLSRNLSLSSLGTVSISLVRQSTGSINAQFIPRSSIQIHTVLIYDDDVEIDRESFEFAFRVWQSNSDRLIGTFVRSHDVDDAAEVVEVVTVDNGSRFQESTS